MTVRIRLQSAVPTTTTRDTMNLIEFCDLVAGYDPAWIAAYLKIKPRTLKRWKEGTSAVPHSAVLALKTKLDGEVACFAGEGWKGFFFAKDGKLYLPYFKRGLEPMQLCAMFFQVQELHHMRRELRRLETTLKEHQANTWALHKVNELLKGTHHDNRNDFLSGHSGSGNPTD